ALFHDLLQRRDERLPHPVVEIVRFLDDEIERLALLAHEELHPPPGLRVPGGGPEVPPHRRTSSRSRFCAALDSAAPPVLWMRKPGQSRSERERGGYPAE